MKYVLQPQWDEMRNQEKEIWGIKNMKFKHHTHK